MNSFDFKIEIVENNGLNKKIKITLGSENIANIGEIYYLVGKEDEDKMVYHYQVL